MRIKIDVVGAVFTRGDLVLAARRGPGKAMAGMWEFPGGKIEPGEQPQEALIRELEEELLIRAEVGELIVSITHPYEFADVTLSTFYCELPDGEPTLTEHTEIRWVHRSELLTLEWAPADIPTVELLQNRSGE